MLRRNMYDDILNNFELYYPNFAEKAIGWYASGSDEITVTLKDRNKIIYNDFDKTTRSVKYPLKPNGKNIDEEYYLKSFAYKLKQRMKDRTMSQKILADITGITQPMISNYLTGKTIPNHINVVKIADALGCSVSEFTYFD